MLIAAEKNWNNHVAQAEEIARCDGFKDLRDRILELAEPLPGETVIDIGAGTGLLTLALAEHDVQIWALDIAPAMCDYLRTKAASAGAKNVQVCTGSAVSLPFVEEFADLVVSNYCLHHLDAAGKDRALSEILRVLRPGGRLVFGDMMFTLNLAGRRDRAVVGQKVRAMVRKGPAGILRLTRNVARLATGRWEHPADADRWRGALQRAGFEQVRVDVLAHEGGVASARKA
jgi:ubiquinone/menaquinone biosynthesis C-methylase UbiE